MAANVSQVGYATYQFISNPTLGNATRIGIQS